jgi:hypothetical protein
MGDKRGIDDLVRRLTDSRGQLKDIVRRASQDGLFDAADERLMRWKKRTARLIRGEVSDEEARHLEKTELGVFTAGDSLGNLADEAGLYDGVLDALMEEIRDNPDVVLHSSSANSIASAVPAAVKRLPGRNEREGIDIFVSHSSKDVKIARALVELLRMALNIPASKIRCASVEGHRLPLGTDTDERIREEIFGAKVFVGLITQTSWQSAYVMFELGARWGTGLTVDPVFAAGVDASILRGPIAGKNGLSCDSQPEVLQLVTDIGSQLEIDSAKPESYSRYVDELIHASKARHEELGNEGEWIPKVPAEQDSLIIYSAFFGTGPKRFNVTGRIKSWVTGDKLKMLVHISELGDPAPGIPKELTVEYIYKSQLFSKTVGEGEVLSLP